MSPISKPPARRPFPIKHNSEAQGLSSISEKILIRRRSQGVLQNYWFAVVRLKKWFPHDQALFHFLSQVDAMVRVLNLDGKFN